MNTTNMNASGDPRIFRPPNDVITALRIRYQVILPIFITFGIIANTFTLFVSTRPKLRSFHFNLYILLLSLLDLLGFIMRIPLVFDFEYCGYSNYSMAFYMTHFGWLIVNYFRVINSYVLVFLSLDRFTAVWFPDKFKINKRTNIGKKRMAFTASWVFITVFIPWSCFGKVSECSNGHQWLRIYSIDDQRTWLTVFKYYSLLVLAGIPSISIIAFSIAIALGFFKKNIYRKESIGICNQTTMKKFYHTIAILTLNSSYAVCCFPYMVAALYMKTGLCYGGSSYAKETLHHLLELLASFWSIANMVIFFLLNSEYKIELKRVLKKIPMFKNYIIDDSHGWDTTKDTGITNHVQL